MNVTTYVYIYIYIYIYTLFCEKVSKILSTLSPDQVAKLSAKEGECLLLRRKNTTHRYS